MSAPDLSDILGDEAPLLAFRTSGESPSGRLPINDQMLRDDPSGNRFGLTQNTVMDWRASEIGHDLLLIFSASSGLGVPDGAPIALGYPTGDWRR